MCHSTPGTTSLQEQSKFSRLHYDVIDIITHSVFDDSRQDLLRLCLVSKMFYFSCIPWIYRQITVNFLHRPAEALLQRLRRTTTNLNRYVQTVMLQNCGIATMDQWVLLEKALSRLKRLKTLSWDSHANIPEFLLGSIHTHHPEATIRATVQEIYAANGTLNSAFATSVSYTAEP
jgi:hypothetical protein